MTTMMFTPSTTARRRTTSTQPLPLAYDPNGCLKAAIEARVGRRIRDLRVELVGDDVVIHGRADSYHAKQLAQHVVGVVSGRTILANRIEVRPPAGTTPCWPVAQFRFTNQPSVIERN